MVESCQSDILYLAVFIYDSMLTLYFVVNWSVSIWHCSTTYVDAAYCYRRSMQYDREPCKTAEPIEMPFGMWTPAGLKKYVLDGVTLAQTMANTTEPVCVRRRCGLMSSYFGHLLPFY